MPDVTITIGRRDYEVACQPGEEEYLASAAAMLNAEAASVAAQGGLLTESRTLLMAGLLLADRTAGIEEQLRARETELAELRAAMDRMSAPPPDRIEVPVIPNHVLGAMAELAARSEALAQAVEERGTPEDATP